MFADLTYHNLTGTSSKLVDKRSVLYQKSVRKKFSGRQKFGCRPKFCITCRRKFSNAMVKNTGLKLEELDEKAVVYQSVCFPYLLADFVHAKIYKS